MNQDVILQNINAQTMSNRYANISLVYTGTRLGVSGSIFFSPLYGMPILKADKAKSEDICKKS